MAVRPKSIVPKVGEPDVDESYIRQQDAVLLKTLLIDRTMTALNGGSPVNIKWAVDDYAKEHPDKTGYGCEDQIALDAISSSDGEDLKVVTPRVKKRREEQERRTAQKAEVFTPSWICNEQNNLVDEAWFGRKDNLFNKPNPDYKTGFDFGADYPQLRWKATYGRHSIPFLHNKKGRTWKDYVKARMMTKTARENCLTEEEAKRIKPMTVERLVSMGLLCETRGKLVPTNGYLIVAGENVPGIRPPRVRCRAYRGTDKAVWYDQRECEGPIAEQIHDAYAFVCKNMRVGSELVATRRRDVYELPVGSVREAICNAVFHRNYLEPSEVYVALYDDRLEITSPGGLVRDMTIEQAEHGYSKIRNDGLAFALSYMKEVEGWGGGVARHFSDWTTAGLPRPKLEETPGFFKVVFDRKRKANEPLNETVNDTVNETVKSIVANLICKAPGIGSAALVSAVGKSRATVMRAVALLKQQGIIEHRGSDKTGGYFLTASAHKEAK